MAKRRPRKGLQLAPPQPIDGAPAAGEPRILALDVATSCGFAHSDGKSGVWDLSGWKDIPARACKLVDAVEAFAFDHPVDLLAMESLVSYSHKGGRTCGLLVLARLVAAVECWAYRRGAPIVSFAPASIKVFATGSGRATKDDMRAAAGRAGLKTRSHDEADAFWCLRLAQHRHRLGLE